MKYFYKILFYIFIAENAIVKFAFADQCPENEICNPLGVDTFTELLAKILKWFTIVSAPIAAIMIIVGGFQYITSSGDQSKVKKAKDTITWAVVGWVIILLAWSIVLVIKNFLGIK